MNVRIEKKRLQIMWFHSCKHLWFGEQSKNKLKPSIDSGRSLFNLLRWGPRFDLEVLGDLLEFDKLAVAESIKLKGWETWGRSHWNFAKTLQITLTLPLLVLYYVEYLFIGSQRISPICTSCNHPTSSVKFSGSLISLRSPMAFTYV